MRTYHRTKEGHGMPVIGIRSEQKWDYVLEADDGRDSEVVELGTKRGKPTEACTFFQLGAISSRVMAEISDTAAHLALDGDMSIEDLENAQAESVGVKLHPNEQAYRIVQHGLKGWRNFKDASGTDIQFSTIKTNVGKAQVDVVAPECMDALRLEWIRELSDAIKKGNTVTPEAAKA